MQKKKMRLKMSDETCAAAPQTAEGAGSKSSGKPNCNAAFAKYHRLQTGGSASNSSTETRFSGYVCYF